jgi:hypothetical protein
MGFIRIKRPSGGGGGGSGAGLSIVGVGDLLWIQLNSSTYFENAITVHGTLQVDGLMVIY